jgi:uncharacterized protein (TIGR02444 family)
VPGRGIWPWAQAAYARPGVAEACLTLQDRHGQNVCLLLWAAWSGAPAQRLPDAVALVRRWEGEVVGPVRQARRALKSDIPPISEGGRLQLREVIRAAELDAERLLLEALASLGPPERTAAAGSLDAAAAAWGRSPPDAALAALARALD